MRNASPFGALSGLRGLYAICDADACQRRSLDFVECARAMFDAAVPVVQIRAKGRDARFMGQVVDGLLAGRDPRGPLLFVNDRADVAALHGADGVHVGQDDLPPHAVKSSFQRLGLGLSTHDEMQVRAALEQPLDYLALGPIFKTTSKRDPEPEVGLAVLQRCGLLARARGVPLVAIGGIEKERFRSVAAHSEFIAAISAILPEDSKGRPYETIRRRCQALQRLVCDTPRS